MVRGKLRMKQLAMPHITGAKGSRCKQPQDGQATATARKEQQQRNDCNESDSPGQLANRSDTLACEECARNTD